MSFSKTFALVAFTFFFVVSCPADVSASSEACLLYRLHSSAPAPRETKILAAHNKFPKKSRFESEYEAWKRSHPSVAATKSHKLWLACALPYLKSDSDHDGIPDWNGMIDRQPSKVLIPMDDDIDGDGLANLFDPAPFAYGPLDLTAGLFEVPRHLKLAGVAKTPQSSLYNEYGLLALNHSDKHSAASLHVLLSFLRSAVPRVLFTTLPSVKILYAYQGHDLRYDIAAYHRDMKAISLVGQAALGDSPLSEAIKIRLISSFAHELGHAFAFDRLEPKELQEVAIKFGGWRRSGENKEDFYGPSFFRPHELREAAGEIPEDPLAARHFTQERRWKNNSLVSRYATENVHEWFAEAFAAHLMARWIRTQLSEGGGDRGGKASLIFLPQQQGDFWANFDNLSPGLAAWIEQKLRRP